MRKIDNAKIENLRDKALEMIVNEGFKGLSMQKLADAAGLSPATIYIYYRDRQDMLNSLYLYVFEASNSAALENFDPATSFSMGMRVLWLNRFNYFSNHRLHYLFLEQFINSPLIESANETEDKTYSTNMQQFYANALRNNQVKSLPIEVYWSVAFAPLYQLIKFHVQKGSKPMNRMGITEQQVLQCLDLVLEALKP